MNEPFGQAPQIDPLGKGFDAVMSDAATQLHQEPVKKSRSSASLEAIKETIINYIVPLVSLILSLLIGFFVLYPSYKSLPELQAQLEQKQKLKSNLSSKLENLHKLSDFKNVVDEDSQLVSKVLVSEQLIPGLLTQVDKLTQEAGLSVNRLNYGVGTATQAAGGAAVTYNVVTVNLGVNGSFEQVKTFLNRLEKAARIIDVDKIRYTLSESDAGKVLGVNSVLVSPYLYVESNAVTDEPIDLDISNPKFVDLINKIKNLNYCDPNEINIKIKVEEAKEEDLEKDKTGDELIEEVTEQESLQGGGAPATP